MKNYYLLYSLLILSLIIGCKDSGNSDFDYTDSDAPVEARVEDLLSKMTLQEKIGQMTQIERAHIGVTTIRDYYLGSVLSGGGSSPGNTAAAWADMYDQFQEQALATRLKIPIIYGVDAVHGHNNLQGAVIFPHNIGLGCTRNPELVEEAARITALEVAATGIDWTFAPAIPVTRDERWGRTYESFGETAELAEELGRAAIAGYQGDDLSSGVTIAACAKHFIGDGGTLGGDDQGNTVVDETTLRNLHLPGYLEAIDMGVATIMASYSSWNGDKVHGSQYLLTELLKEELGFEGFIISDWAAINQLPGNYSRQVEAAINAGIDMVMVPDDYDTFITTLANLVANGSVSEERIDDAVARILKVKFELGLFEEPFTDRSLMASIGSEEHRAVARQAVRESMVLLKNQNSVLPLSKSADILVAGANGNDLGHQMGGWSIWWQGGSGNITTGTTIYEGIQDIGTGSISFSQAGTGVANSDVAVAVIGETPYAEGQGDKNDLSLSQADINLVKNLKASGKPVVVIIVSGRPLIIDSIINYADAIIAAWLPGTEGSGVADVLFGDYNFTGKLSVSWPRSNAQIPINVGDAGYDPLFEYGFGLSY